MPLVKRSLPMDFKFSRVIAVFLFALLASTSVAEEKKPNVLFISVDDLNDWTGALKGHPQAKTPHLDRLAASGILFENAHCAERRAGLHNDRFWTGARHLMSGA